MIAEMMGTPSFNRVLAALLFALSLVVVQGRPVVRNIRSAHGKSGQLTICVGTSWWEPNADHVPHMPGYSFRFLHLTALMMCLLFPLPSSYF